MLPENLKFGVEIEFYNASKKSVAQLVQKILGGKLNIANSYRYEVLVGDKKWQIVKDASLHNSVDEPKPYKQQFTGELVTPILTYKNLPVLLNLVEEMEKENVKSDREHGCSVHVHVDANHLSLEDIKQLCRQHYVIYDELVDKFCLSDRQVKTFAKNLSSKFIKELDNITSKDKLRSSWYGYHNPYQQKQTSHYNKSRYTIFNLHSMYEGHGVEYRYFKFYGNLDSYLLKNIINYSLLMTLPHDKVYDNLEDLLENISTDKIKVDSKLLLNQQRYEVTNASIDDVVCIYDLYQERVNWFKEKRIKQWTSYLQDHPKEELSKLIQSGCMYKVLLNNTLVGAFELSNNSELWKDSDSAYYLRGAVAKVGTRGIGKKIVSFCRKKCREDNKKYLREYNATYNKKLDKLFEDKGFKLVKHYSPDKVKFSLRQIEF